MANNVSFGSCWGISCCRISSLWAAPFLPYCLAVVSGHGEILLLLLFLLLLLLLVLLLYGEGTVFGHWYECSSHVAVEGGTPQIVSHHPDNMHSDTWTYNHVIYTRTAWQIKFATVVESSQRSEYIYIYIYTYTY